MKLRLALMMVVACASACAPRPMFVGPPTSLPEQELQFTAGASWAKPIDSRDLGTPQIDAAFHLPVSDRFNLALRAWSLGGGMQGRIGALSRAHGSSLDLMISPLVGVSTVVGYKEEGDERLLPPLNAEFLVTAPFVAGIGVGTCSVYAGGDPVLHLRPALFVLRAAALVGFACPTKSGSQIAPEISFEAPLVGGADLKPEDGFTKGERRPPLLATTVRLGVAFTF